MNHKSAEKAKDKAASYKKEGSDEAKSERKDGKMPKELLEHFKNKAKKKSDK